LFVDGCALTRTTSPWHANPSGRPERATDARWLERPTRATDRVAGGSNDQ
jgi:hypothetical protein